jgi:DNA-directed RNA polymerase subunit N (RpoN/RPB10)
MMGQLTITVFCPTCGKQIEAEYVGKYKELLRKILQRAGHQPGDTSYAEIMEQINFPGE